MTLNILTGTETELHISIPSNWDYALILDDFNKKRNENRFRFHGN